MPSAKEEAMTVDLAMLLKVGGVLHLGLMAAGLLMPQAVGLRTHLTTLPEFIRRLFWVYTASSPCASSASA